MKAAYGYTPYGQADDTLTKGDTQQLQPINPFRFIGKYHDPATGSVDMGARRYTPNLGRFFQQDRYYGALSDLGLTLDPLTGNRYAYAAGRPTGYVEDDGHKLCSVDGHCERAVSDDTTSDSASNGGDPPIIDGWAAAHLADNSDNSDNSSSGGGGSSPTNYSRALAYIYQEMVKNSRGEDVAIIRAGLALSRNCTRDPSLFEVFTCAFIDPNQGERDAAAHWGSLVCHEVCPWDHKPKLEKRLHLVQRDDFFFTVKDRPEYELYYDIFSNIHYGYVGTAAGFDAETLQKAASSNPFAGANDVGDVITVQIGIDLYARRGPEQLTAEDIHQAILDAIPELRAAGATQLRPAG